MSNATERYPMPSRLYQTQPITDPTELLAFIRDSLRANSARAVDGLRATGEGDSLDARDALGMILNDLAHTLAVIKASKDTI